MWSRLQKPWYFNGPSDIAIAPDGNVYVSDFEKIDLSCNLQDVCQGRYERFDLKGEFRISFYAMDNNEDVSFSETLIINQTQGKTVIPTLYDEQRATVYLRDVVVEGKHFQAAMEI